MSSWQKDKKTERKRQKDKNLKLQSSTSLNLEWCLRDSSDDGNYCDKNYDYIGGNDNYHRDGDDIHKKRVWEKVIRHVSLKFEN